MKSSVAKLLIIYDFLLLPDGKENFGTNKIFEEYLVNKNTKFNTLKSKFSFSVSNLISKLIRTGKFLYKENYSIIISYNFVNAIFCWILKIILFKNYKIVFASLDFTNKRFNNIILDNLYVLGDFLASKLSDFTWSSSRRVYEYRMNFLNKKKNIYIPNIPMWKKKNLKKFPNFTIIMISHLGNNYQFSEVYKLFQFLKKKNIHLYIIGQGERKEEIEKEIINQGLSKNVHLTGYLPHDEILYYLEKSHVGLALYAGQESYNYWGDSIKIREYTYYELPTITTNNVYNAKEVIEKNLGLVIDSNRNLYDAVKILYTDKNLYKSIHNACIEYNKKYRLDVILDEALKNVL